MKNIHVLPTDKPSRLISCGKEFTLLKKVTVDKRCKHIYITSDEGIEEGDFALNLNTKTIVQYDGIKGLNSNYKKIILTTDQDLINDGLQKIDDKFLEWFVKNPNCKFVEVKTDYVQIYPRSGRDASGNEIYDFIYKIILPQEETKSHGFCEIPEEKCIMSYCDENRRMNRKREFVEEPEIIPTAKELFDKMLLDNDETTSTEMMIKFAKLHVKAALEEVQSTLEYYEGCDLIKDLYSLDNIK